MNTSSSHIAFAGLANLVEGRVTADERTAFMAHISNCSHCAGELQRISHVMELMRADRTEDAPRDVLALAVNLFGRRAESREPSLLRRIVAALTFDSLNTAPAFGVRSGQAASRQLLYSAEETDVDLRITVENDHWVVAGQVLGENCSGGQVVIEGETGSTSASLNNLCEFTLPAVPAGSYTLRLRLKGVELEVPQLELRT